MLMRAACIVLVVSLGLSACTLPILKRSDEAQSPSAIPEVGQGTETSSPQRSPVAPSDSATDTIEPTEIPQIQAAPATSQAAESINASPSERPPYRLQAGTPRAITNFIQPSAGCNWMGVGGQAFNLSRQPVTSLVVEVGGTLAGADVFHLELTGNQPNLGPGGYLITLSNRPIASSGSLWILLYNLAGQPLTSKIYFTTVQDCTSNFILINFVEVNPNIVPQMYFPLMSK